jgi:hypothetical protein
MTKFVKAEKIGCSDFLFRTVRFDSFRAKPRKELNLKI